MMRSTYAVVFLVAVISCSFCSAGSEGNGLTRNVTTGDERDAKFVSLFTVVRFENKMCTASNGYNGTCMTSAECTAGSGTTSGSCASGFGVCCVFTYTSCQQTSNRNCTYWQNPGGASSSYSTIGQCNFLVKKCSSDICQIRLDFLSFTLAQPETTNGVCSTDIFTVVSGASNPVPIICGDNTGQHMYLDMTPNTDTFELSIITTTSTFSRSWNIKATQLSCLDSRILAPDQCLQYYQTSTGTIQSFNYKSQAVASGMRQLANQDYTICIRMNAGFCGICYSVCPDTLNTAQTTTSAAFSISLASGASTAQAGDANCLLDFLQIPCASDQRSPTNLQSTGASCVSKLCGAALSSITGAAIPAPVYSYRKPFEVRYFTDSTEVAADTNNLGFCLTYVQQPCVTTSG